MLASRGRMRDARIMRGGRTGLTPPRRAGSVIASPQSRLPMASVLRILLIVALLGAQLLLGVHEADLSAHVDGHGCEVCLHGKPLGHGLQAPPPPALATAQAVPALAPLPQSDIARPARPRARSPPRLS